MSDKGQYIVDAVKYILRWHPFRTGQELVIYSYCRYANRGKKFAKKLRYKDSNTQWGAISNIHDK